MRDKHNIRLGQVVKFLYTEFNYNTIIYNVG